MSETWSRSSRRSFVKTGILAAGVAALPVGVRRAAATTPPVIGEWSPVYAWPDVAIHLHLLPDGRVLTYSDDDVPFLKDRNADFSKAYVVEIPAGMPPGAVTYVPNNVTNLFCSGHAFLPDGRLLVTGGHAGQDNYGEPDATIFMAASGGYTWYTTNTPMNDGRWYSSAITLANGEVLVIGGSRSSNNFNTLPQVWRTNQGGGWRDLTAANAQVPNYAKLHLAPNGRVAMVGPAKGTRYLDTAGTGRWTNGPVRPGPHRDYGASAQYDDGKILIFGGGNNPPVNSAETIDLKATTPTWRATGSMSWARRHVNATVLPDGTVLATGGSSSAGNDAAGTVLAAELWDPATGQWTTMASAQVPRIYHSTTLLLPDGRVLSAGGGRPKAQNGGAHNLNAEFYSPPYLFKGTRPTLHFAPASATYGQTIQLFTPFPAEIGQVNLIRLGSVTHTVNMNQFFRRLSFAPAAGGGIAATLPHDPRLLPPGHYMLFILNRSGVPSLARIIQIA